MDAYKNKRGEQLKPLNVGPRTWLLVSPDKATKERADKRIYNAVDDILNRLFEQFD